MAAYSVIRNLPSGRITSGPLAPAMLAIRAKTPIGAYFRQMLIIFRIAAFVDSSRSTTAFFFSPISEIEMPNMMAKKISDIRLASAMVWMILVGTMFTRESTILGISRSTAPVVTALKPMPGRMTVAQKMPLTAARAEVMQ